VVRDCVSISLLKAATAVSGLHGWLQIADITAKKSAPARIKTPQFSTDMPPMATHGTVVELRHQVRMRRPRPQLSLGVVNCSN